MREVSLTRFQLFHPFSWGPLERNASFLPRVRYKKAVLSVAQWNLGPSIFDKKKDLVEQFNDWAEKWALPQKSLCGHLDQYLLIDRHHPASLREIVLKIKKGEPLQFIEELPQTWLQSDEGSHAVELVFPMLKNPVYATKTQFSAPAYSEIAFRDRVKLLGEEWVYLKIYLDPAEADRFLIEQITPLLQDKKLFFIRYRDNGFHLRLRIEMTPFLIEELTDKVAYWMEAGLIHNVLWAPYEREIERYGGLELIGQAEMLFCEDSDDVLQELFSEQDVTSRAISGCRFLKGFGFDRSQMISLLQGNLRSLQALSGFRKHKSQLMTSMTEMLAEEGSSDAKRAFREKGTGLSEEKVFGIYNSLLHMHYNRLGCNRSEEEKARLYALHTLVQIEKRMPRDNICHEASISQCP